MFMTRGSSSTISWSTSIALLMSRATTKRLREREAPLHRQRVLVDDARQRLDGLVSLVVARVQTTERVLEIEVGESCWIVGDALEIRDRQLHELCGGILRRLATAGVF